MTGQCLVASLGGVPMIDDRVDAATVLTLACAVRQRLDAGRRPLAAYRQPERARACYLEASIRATGELASTDPNLKELRQIRRTCKHLCATVPQWSASFSIPLRWRRLDADLSSSSNPLIPQHIFLGKRSFASQHLPEIIAHELSHTWVGMIAEVAPLARPSEARHMLPSGTGNKDMAQVIYAMTFAATAIRFHRARIAATRHLPQDRDRLAWLEHYLEGCLRMVESGDEVLPNGLHIAQSCRRLLHA